MIYDEKDLDRALRDTLGFAMAKVMEREKKLSALGSVAVLNELRKSETLVADVALWRRERKSQT